MTYFIGIDNSSLDHKVHILKNNGDIYSKFIIENSLDGFNKLHETIKNFDQSMIGFELPHGPLTDFLRQKNYIAYSLNPLKIKRFKETTIVSGNKDDNIDAAAIAEYMRKNSAICRPLLYNSSEVEKLKILCIVHSRMSKENTRYKNKLHFAIKQYFSLHESLFTNFGCTVQIEMLMKYPTFKDLRQASEDDLISFLKTNKYRVPKYIRKVIDKIKKYDQIVSPDVEYVYSMEVKMLCEILRTVKLNLKNVEKEMESILDNHHMGHIFRSLPGAGIILGSKLLALFGDNFDRFDTASQAQCLFGTAPKNYQSGNYHKVLMRKACNKHARAVLFKYAFESLNRSTWARTYYDEQRNKGKTHSVAIRALSNKWVKVIFKLWKDDIFYEEEKKISSVA